MNKVPFSEMAILILAAGNSSRMGKPKQLLPWKQATLIEEAVHTAQSLTDSFEVVLGANAAQIIPYIPKGKATINKKWQEGMGGSIAYGVASIEEKYDPKAILVMVADQPFLALEHYRELMNHFGNNPTVMYSSSYDGRPGVPTLFPRFFFGELKKLGADYGARKLMEVNKDSVEMIETKGELIDLDTPEDYRLALSRLGT